MLDHGAFLVRYKRRRTFDNRLQEATVHKLHDQVGLASQCRVKFVLVPAESRIFEVGPSLIELLRSVRKKARVIFQISDKQCRRFFLVS